FPLAPRRPYSPARSRKRARRDARRFLFPKRFKPHDLRRGVAMEVLEQHHDLERWRSTRSKRSGC
ncbi:MAG: hypothetical protein Q8S13_12400, partial [Dehalococcoidia bacterium]|nr:hypothetical protein [Dehalococcoidia bacterium]